VLDFDELARPRLDFTRAFGRGQARGVGRGQPDDRGGCQCRSPVVLGAAGCVSQTLVIGYREGTEVQPDLTEKSTRETRNLGPASSGRPKLSTRTRARPVVPCKSGIVTYMMAKCYIPAPI
jgi:hypothetical protein